jgi:hypothetical protein
MSENQSLITDTEDQDAPKLDDNDRIIASMNTLREKFISDLVKDGKAPGDKDDRAFLLSLMDGATRSALASKKLKLDKEAVVSQAQQVQNLVEAVRMAQSHRSTANRESLVAERVVPKLEPTVVPGHMDRGTLPINTTALSRAAQNNQED